MPIAAWGADKWELFDLSVDPGETTDLSEKHPDKLKELIADWDQYCKETGTVWGEPIKAHRENWAATPQDSVGGDPFEQQNAWMEIGEGQIPRETKPYYKVSAA